MKHRHFHRFGHVLFLFLGMALLLSGLIGLSWFASSLVQAQSNPTNTPNPSLIFRPTLQETGLPPIVSPTQTPSRTASPFATLTATPSLTASHTPTSTATPSPTVTLTDTYTATAIPSTSAPSATLTASATATASITSTTTPSATPSSTTTFTQTTSPTATATQTYTNTPTASPTDTATSTPTNTVTSSATSTPTQTATPSDTPTLTPTTTRVPPVVESSRPNEPPRDTDDPSIPLWGLGLGLIGTLLIGGYIVAHAWSAGTMDRYSGGFDLTVCPICDDGNLILEERPYSVIGIPRVRRTVRCDNCRSVLREVGNRQWRYAVDPAPNPNLYDRLNNEVLQEDQLLELAFEIDSEPPTYLDDDN